LGVSVKRAILLVDHGSRRTEANAHLAAVADAVRARIPGETVEIAHMDIAEPTIAQGIARCVDSGAQLIVVHPYFLGPGRHAQESIPKLVDAAAQQHPDVKIRMSDPLGLHAGLIDAVLDRVAEIT
jgi:sirohydrochlorin ferrochelatase